MINGSHHAREYMTTVLILNQMEYLCQAYSGAVKTPGYEAKKMLDETSVWFIPLVNPDGVEICVAGIKAIKNPSLHKKLVGLAKHQTEWKSNGRGVDLNRNYDANWHHILNRAKAPSSRNYPGPVPFSEPETKALRDFCFNYELESTISYHSAGQVIFWHFMQSSKEDEARDRAIALELSKITGYGLIKPQVNPSGGGFKDWFIITFKKPSYTLEIGKVVKPAPLKYEEYPKVWKDNKDIPLYLVGKVNTKLNPRKPDLYDIEGKELVSAVKKLISLKLIQVEEDKYGNKILNKDRQIDKKEAIDGVFNAYRNRYKTPSDKEKLQGLYASYTKALKNDKPVRITNEELVDLIFVIERTLAQEADDSTTVLDSDWTTEPGVEVIHETTPTAVEIDGRTWAISKGIIKDVKNLKENVNKLYFINVLRYIMGL